MRTKMSKLFIPLNKIIEIVKIDDFSNNNPWNHMRSKVKFVKTVIRHYENCWIWKKYVKSREVKFNIVDFLFGEKHVKSKRSKLAKLLILKSLDIKLFSVDSPFT